MRDKCPFCGAEDVPQESIKFRNTLIFDCGTCCSRKFTDCDRGTRCYEHQIANLQASRDRWKELFEAYSEYGMGTYFTSDGEAEVKQAIAALKQAGEWEE